mgnify:CR=1
MTRQLLFLCTGNYYRSRFAEILFNKMAVREGLGWLASSRGLLPEIRSRNPGPISPHAREGLAERGILLEENQRFPLELDKHELAAADRVIALKEAEHRPLLAERFPGWEDRVEYWHVHDLDAAQASVALTQIERQVVALIWRLRRDRAGQL